MDEEIIEKLLKISTDFQGLSEKARNDVKGTFIAKETDGLAAVRLTLDGQISRLFLRFLDKIDNTNEKISYQLYLSASFIRTYFIINDLILSGDIIEAITLIRKQIENLTRLIEINEKPLTKLLKKTPNVCNVLDKMGKSIYPELSEIAHFGTPRVGELIKMDKAGEGKSGPSVLPAFSSKLFDVYKEHAFISITFVFWIIEFLKSIYQEKYDCTSDELLMEHIFTLALDLGIIIETKTEQK